MSITILIFFTIVLPVLKLHISRFTVYAFIKLFSLSMIFLRFISVGFFSNSFHFITLGLFLRLKCILGRNYLPFPKFLKHTKLQGGIDYIAYHCQHCLRGVFSEHGVQIMLHKYQSTSLWLEVFLTAFVKRFPNLGCKYNCN